MQGKKYADVTTPFQTKVVEIDTQFQTKTAKKPYPLAPHIPI